VEASALGHTARLPALAGRSPLLRLQTDEKLIALIRRGHHGAFEALVQRYQPRLLAFCRHMLSSQEDAEDVLQEVFAASFNAICADERPINARPWLYRIARNRCLNHLRRPQPAGQDSMDVFERDGGASTADTVHKRAEFLHLVSDVQELPETQRTALLLREIDALSYDQIAEAMDTTVPSVKSLLVRARVSLAEAAEARLLTCDEVRLELGQVAEGLGKTSAPARRHLRSCERCRVFKSELRKTTRALAAVYPIGPLVFLKKLSLAKLGIGGAASGAAATGGAGSGAAGIAGTAATAAGGLTAGGAVSAGVGTIASKAAAGVAAAAIVTAGAVEVRHATVAQPPASPAPIAAAAPQLAAPA
jgi:RNA polymerase sigma factor (sigma-70 family)